MTGEPERRHWWRDLRLEIAKTVLAVLRTLMAAGRFVLWLIRWGAGDPS